jgi:hypothetical protein
MTFMKSRRRMGVPRPSRRRHIYVHRTMHRLRAKRLP